MKTVGARKVRLSQLKREGYEGEDFNLAICLREQGFASKEFKRRMGMVKKGSYRIIYRVRPDNVPTSELWFNARIIDRDLDWSKEWAHLFDDKERFFKWMDLTEEEFSLETISRQVNLLLDYFGFLNVFGNPNHTFQISGL